MNMIEFETELDGKTYLTLPEKVASQLPKTGHAKVIVFRFCVGKKRVWRNHLSPVLTAWSQSIR